MKLRSTLVSLLVLLLVGASSAAESPGQDVPGGEAGWPLARRVVPPPAAASAAVRDAIATAPVPDVSASRRSAPKDAKEWAALIRQRDAGARAMVKTLTERLAVSIEHDQVRGVGIRRVTPAKIDPLQRRHLFLHLHGGAYVFNGGEAGLYEAALIAERVGIPVVSIDYRTAPAHPFPAALDDVVKVYEHLLESAPAKSLAIGGSSAGGGLALASVHALLARDLAVPGAIYAGTPWADLTKTGDTLYTNEGLDRMIVSYDGLLTEAARLYAGGKNMKNPLISPVYGNFEGFPPVYLVTGTRDLLLSDTARIHRKLRSAGVDADLDVYEGLSHAEYIFVRNSIESQQAYAEMKGFLAKHLR